MGTLFNFTITKFPLSKEIPTLIVQVHAVGYLLKWWMLDNIEIKATLIKEIKSKQFENENFNELKAKTLKSKA